MNKKEYEFKFPQLIKAIEGCKVEGAALIIASRWVIGDDEEELKESFRRIEEAGIVLVIVDEQLKK